VGAIALGIGAMLAQREVRMFEASGPIMCCKLCLAQDDTAAAKAEILSWISDSFSRLERADGFGANGRVCSGLAPAPYRSAAALQSWCEIMA